MPARDDLEELMQYMCLVYQDEAILNALEETDYKALVGDALGYVDELRKTGHHVSANALQLVDTATTVRLENGRVSVTDGPFAETKEQLGGYYLIEARDLNEAIRLAAKIPSARLGPIEIRPIQDLTTVFPGVYRQPGEL